MAGNEDVPICPDCGHLTRFIPSKNSYWCTNCSKFVDLQNNNPSPPVDQSTEPGPAEEPSADLPEVCPKCGNPPRYIEQYNRYWCENCSEYLPEEFGKSPEELTSPDEPKQEQSAITQDFQYPQEEMDSSEMESASDYQQSPEITVSPETETVAEVEEEPDTIPEKESEPEPQPEEVAPELICPQCGKKVRYLEQYDRYWCDTCTEYMSPDFGTEEYIQSASDTSITQSSPEQKEMKLTCPNCGNEVRYLQQYERYWCDTCADYMSPDFGKAASEPQVEQQSTPDAEDIIPQDSVAEQSEQSLTCPHCQSKLRFVELYDKYWCDNCAQYVELETVTDTEPEQTEPPVSFSPEPEPTAESEPSPMEDLELDSLKPEILENIEQEIEIPQQPPVEDEQLEPSIEESTPPVDDQLNGQPEHQTELNQNEQSPPVLCPVCGQVTRFVETYDRYWCDQCSEYLSPEIEQESSPEAVEETSEQSDLSEPVESETQPERSESDQEYSQEDEELFKSLESDIMQEEETEPQGTESEVSELSIPDKIDQPETEESTEQGLLCPNCNQAVRYVEQYDRYWCDNCSEYMPIGFGKSEQSEPSADVSPADAASTDLVCPECGNNVVFNQQYERYWCEHCSKYMPLDFGEEKVYVEDKQTIQTQEQQKEPEQPEPEISPEINIQHDITPLVSSEDESPQNDYSEQLTTPVKSGEESLAEETAEKELQCPECSSDLRYIEQYQRYWCDNCSKYMSSDFGTQTKQKYFCPKCGVELARCHPCNKYWCKECDQCYSSAQLSG